MDMRMPKMGGVAPLKQIRAGSGPNRRAPILAYTADAGEDLEAGLSAQGLCSVVSKPVAAEALIRAVSEAVSDA